MTSRLSGVLLFGGGIGWYWSGLLSLLTVRGSGCGSTSKGEVELARMD